MLRQANRQRRRERWKPDVIHLHGLDFHSYLPPAGPPALVTLHLPPQWYPAGAFHPERPDTWLVCVSSKLSMAQLSAVRLFAGAN